MLEADLTYGKTGIWLVNIAKETSLCRAKYLDLLTLPELEKSNKFRKRSDSDRYIVTRVILRLILASYVGLKPEDLQFSKNTAGKPELAGGPHFNLSHAGQYIVLACSASPVGIDLEFVNPEFRYEDILATCFKSNEQQIIGNDENPRRAFYYAWTRKEAVLKKEGLGISDNLPGVDISFRHGLINLDVDAAHVLALAYDGRYPPPQIRSFTLS